MCLSIYLPLIYIKYTHAHTHTQLSHSIGDTLFCSSVLRYRLDHSPLLLAQEKGAEGHTLHGGAVTESGEPAWPLAYEFRHGKMRNQLLTVCMQLRDAGPVRAILFLFVYLACHTTHFFVSLSCHTTHPFF